MKLGGRFLYCVLVFVLLFSRCSIAAALLQNKRQVCFYRTRFGLISNWLKDDHEKALDTFLSSCKCIMKKKPSSNIGFFTEIGQESYKWQQLCLEASKISKRKRKQNARLFFEREFVPYRVSTTSGCFIGRATGYYEVQLLGHIRKNSIYKFPVYSTPSNLENMSGSHYLSRSSIDRGSLSGKHLEIAWVSSKAKLFMAHLQGSASIRLRNGSVIRLSYDGQNGFPHRDITHLFSEYGGKNLNSVLEMMQWLDKNPRIIDKILHKNPSYVFFKTSNRDATVGGQGSELIAGRSVAINPRIYPYGMPIWVQTQLPKTRFEDAKNYSRLMIAQDSGGAIRDPLRVDIFFGGDRNAEEIASKMNEKASYIVFFPKNIRIPSCYVY